MDTGRQNNGDSNNNQIPSTRSLLITYIVSAVVVLLGLGTLAARDLQPITQQHSLEALINYLLTHPSMLVHLLPFVAIYLIVMLVVYFISLVFNRLFPRWAAAVADILDAWLHRFFSRFYARYRQNMRFQLRSLDLGGLPDSGPYSLDLNQVFVDLKVETQAVREGRASPVQPLSPELLERQHRFFDFLMPRHYRNAPHLVIIGPPGSGKTTMLRHTALVLASGRKAQKKATMPARLRRLVPVLLYLHEHAVQVQHAHDEVMKPSSPSVAPYTLEDAVREHLKNYAPDLSVPKGWLLRELRHGRCLVMLDGLDEVADVEQRRILVNWVQGQMVQYKSCRFVVTSRPHGYKGKTLKGVTVLDMCPYTRTQVQEFVHGWYHATEVKRQGNRDDKGARLRARLESEKLLRKIDEHPDIYALATNPLLLTMTCTVHLYKGSLPKRRVELYKDACDVLLVTRQRAKDIPIVLTEDQAKGVLAPLAWAMMMNPRLAEDGRRWPKTNVAEVITVPLSLHTSMSVEDFLRYVHQSGLFLELEPGEFGFAHLTFQEYLAAVYANSMQVERELIARIGDSWWEETIRLYCAQADVVRASAIIEACLPQDETLPRADTLALALACLDEARHVHQVTKHRLQEYIDRCVETPDAERQHIAAAALLANRMREMVYLTESTHYSPVPITCVEYQLFLDELQGTPVERIPLHWATGHFASGDGHEPVLGVLPDDAMAFCAWLTQRFPHEGRTFRLPHPEEAHTLERNVPKALKRHRGFWTQTADGTVAFADSSLEPLTTASHRRLVSLIRDDNISAVTQDIQSIVFARARVCDLAFDRAHIQAFGLALASALAITLDSVLVRALASARTLASNLAVASADSGESDRDLDNALASILALDGTLTIARTRANTLSRDLDLALAESLATGFASNLDFNNARDLVRNLVNARYLARDLASAINNAGARDLARTRAHTLALFRARALARALLDIGRILDSALANASASTFALALALLDDDSARTHARTLVRTLAHTSAFADALASACDFDSILVGAFANDLARADTLVHDRLRAILLTEALKAYGEEGPNDEVTWPPPLRQQREPTWAFQASAERYADVYAMLAVLKGRAEGWLSPSESIVLVCDLL